ncbi:unnamed protein product [Gulo gulo]|uniref:Uncharacterized protein n=1 Tax=Gulo gulo TaxID=48420 RepID=A0A9X9PV28_GULGU|nr:unnamed protein product [Gulo gulo]
MQLRVTTYSRQGLRITFI